MASIEMVNNPADGAGPAGQFHAAELDNIYRALNGHGVIGHTLSMTVTGGDMIVTIPAVNAWVPDGSGGSVYVAYAGGNETISAAHATLPRVDIIELRSGGTVEVVAGTATAETGSVLEAPMPALSANAIMLAKVKVGANVSVIATDKVYGRAIDVSEQYSMSPPKGSDIASAGTITLPDSSAAVFDITGTTTITAISSKPAGAIVIFQFDGALTLTHNATSLVLAGGTNVLTEAGDIVAFVSEGSGNWREIFRRSGNVGLRFEGSDSTERTTTATVKTAMSTITGLNIPVDRWILVQVSARKTAGAANAAIIYLDLNSTEVVGAQNATSAANQAEFTVAEFLIPPRRGVTTYSGVRVDIENNAGADTRGTVAATALAATVTQVVVSGNAANAAQMFAIDEVRVYSYAGA